jgi:hypothetical protein
MEGGQSGRRGPSKTEGTNHPGGITIYYILKDTAKAKVSLEYLTADGKPIKKFSTKPDKKKKEEKLSIKEGMNNHNWNMRYPDAESFDGLIMWAASTRGPKAVPGTYKAKLTVNETSYETEFEILKDPRTSGTLADIQAQFDFVTKVMDKLSETHVAIKNIREARQQINKVTEPLKGKEEMKDITDLAKSTLEKMKLIEESLYQTKNKSGQDPLNFPVRLNNKLGALGGEASSSDFRPNDQTLTVYKEIAGQIDEQLLGLDKIFKTDIPKLNDLIKQKNIDAISFSKDLNQ